MANSMIYFDDHNFDNSIATGVTLVDFYADWCGPCKMLNPIIHEISDEYKGRAVVAKVDVDKAQATAQKYDVTSIPTVILFVDGKEAKRVVGVRGKKDFQNMMDAALTV